MLVVTYEQGLLRFFPDSDQPAVCSFPVCSEIVSWGRAPGHLLQQAELKAIGVRVHSRQQKAVHSTGISSTGSQSGTFWLEDLSTQQESFLS